MNELLTAETKLYRHRHRQGGGAGTKRGTIYINGGDTNLLEKGEKGGRREGWMMGLAIFSLFLFHIYIYTFINIISVTATFIQDTI